MRRHWLNVLLIGALSAWGISWGSPARADDGSGGFGTRVAGTYLDNGDIGGPFTGMQTLGADGTQTATNSNIFGAADGLFQGGAHGAWKRSGPRQITINSVIQVFLPTGEVLITARVTVVVDFGNDFNSADAALTTELFFWGVPGDVSTSPDVLNDVPGLVVCGDASWTRLQVNCTSPPDDSGCPDTCLSEDDDSDSDSDSDSD